MRDMVHAEVEPQHQIGLVQALAVKELIEVYGRILGVLVVVRMRAARLCVLSPRHHDIVLSPSCAVLENRRLLHGQVRSACVW